MNTAPSADTTTSYAEAQHWAVELIGDPNVLQIWIPEAGFVEAVRTHNSISFTRQDDVLFGFGMGPDPVIDPRWERFTLPRELDKSKTEKFELIGRLNVYAISTAAFTDVEDVELLEDCADDIDLFLEQHAPGSSTRPDNPQALFWCGIRDDKGELIAVATVARWESGGLMLSSVATHTERRRMGLGTRITRGTLAHARARDMDVVALGVAARNTEAISIYEKIGFQLLCAANTYSAGQEVPSAGNVPVNK